MCPKTPVVKRRKIKNTKVQKHPKSNRRATHKTQIVFAQKPHTKAKLDPPTVEEELAEFNNFTVNDTTSKEEQDYIDMELQRKISQWRMPRNPYEIRAQKKRF